MRGFSKKRLEREARAMVKAKAESVAATTGLVAVSCIVRFLRDPV
jgi:hypothetical protein